MTPTTAPDPADELLRTFDFAPTDNLLREDVKQLGALVGEILAEQRGPAFLEAVDRGANPTPPSTTSPRRCTASTSRTPPTWCAPSRATSRP